MSSILTRLPLSLLLFNLLFISSVGFTKFTDRHFGSSETDPNREKQAERLVRLLKLFPKHDVNIVKDYSSIHINNPRLVEKRQKSPLPDLFIQFLGNHFGYYNLKNTVSARMFYYFFESLRNKNDPVIIWLAGWPGCSNDLSLFYRNGPFHITKNLSLEWNYYGWNQVSNIIFVDQPIGTGFSYSPDVSDIRHNQTGVSNDLYYFLQKFFEEHPNLTRNDFFIAGESYGGHYIPALASRIQQGNKAKEGIHINLKGFAIGNGLTNLGIQLPATIEYALDMTIVKKKDQQHIWKMIQKCKSSIKECGSMSPDKIACFKILTNCGQTIHGILEVAGNINFFDIAKKCKSKFCYDFTSVESILKNPIVKEAMHVGVEFVSCNPTVFMAMLGDWFENLDAGIPDLLKDGIKFLNYAGERDLICNWLGNARWVHAMNWYGKSKFKKAPITTYVVDREKVGKFRSYEPLTFLKVFNAGHLVAMDRPKIALHIIENWIKGNFP